VGKSDDKTKSNIIRALRDASGIKPYYNNWILFSAMIETALLKFSGEWDEFKVEMAFRKFDEWYKGDGWYGDGPDFHFDYYNSIVIQPFMLKIIFEQEAYKKTAAGNKITFAEPLLKKPKYLEISQRYAVQQEMLIASDGSYATFGRSLCYRFGVFHHLSFMSLQKLLPENLNAGQVPAALTAVIQKVMLAPTNFDDKGLLRIGVYGYQPSLYEGYIDTGSLYLCTAVFQPLGLPATDDFWTAPEQPWTQKKVWFGVDTNGDYHMKLE
jgi:hypothetical protein